MPATRCVPTRRFTRWVVERFIFPHIHDANEECNNLDTQEQTAHEHISSATCLYTETKF